MTAAAPPSSAIEATLRWARDHYATKKVAIVERATLEGGVSGATVERVSLRVDDRVGSTHCRSLVWKRLPSKVEPLLAVRQLTRRLRYCFETDGQFAGYLVEVRDQVRLCE